MACGQGHELLAYDLEPGIGSIENGAGLAFDYSRESRIGLALIRRIENEDEPGLALRITALMTCCCVLLR
jgi:hypothetical protein